MLSLAKMLSTSFVCTALLLSVVSSQQLSPTFYANSCPQALPIVNDIIQKVVTQDKRMGASLLRLHFHDCFVNGCDASVLLDDNPNFDSEKEAGPNRNSLRGFDVIDDIKAQIENVCREVVSCADILAIAARDSVVQLGGPLWEVMLGRRDARIANKTAANEDIPSPFMGFTNLLSAFQKQGLSLTDLVALSGAHTIGQAQCFTFRNRIYEETTIDPVFAQALQTMCPRNEGIGDSNLSPFDVVRPDVFDNKYFKDLMEQKGLLHSDQALLNDKEAAFTEAQIALFSNDQNAFFMAFQISMVNMGNIKPLTGTNGEIRKDCRKPN